MRTIGPRKVAAITLAAVLLGTGGALAAWTLAEAARAVEACIATFLSTALAKLSAGQRLISPDFEVAAWAGGAHHPLPARMT